jgi:hypothetical protein
MPEQLLKLSPHRDLQSYFERPSAIAAISDASATGFCLSGTWRQQYDWAVVSGTATMYLNTLHFDTCPMEI